MKTFLTTILVLLSFVSFSQRKYPPRKPHSIYDSTLAKKLKADDYGMHKYVMCFLKTGPNKSLSADSSKKIQVAHLQNIKDLASQGKLVVAGPFMDETELEGIFILNATTVEEAQTLVNTDPAVKAGVLIMELHPWYGSAALMEVPFIHAKIQKKNF
ncbi:MAG TPA: YciI family protein [Bacteroidia bacterium]|nr:YciI family protein [Bacteroidia bacterium]